MKAKTQRADRETLILDAAADLIVRYGYDKTTVDDIAKAAHISKGAVYLEFRGKEALVETLILRETERMLDTIWERIEQDPKGVTLFTIYRHSIHAIAMHPLIKAMYVKDRRVLGDMVRQLQRLPVYKQWEVYGTSFVEHFQAAGLIRRDLPPDVLGYLLMAIRYGLLTVDEMIPAEGAPSLERVGDVLADMMERGLSPTDVSERDQAEGKAALAHLFSMGRQVMEQQREEREREKQKGKTSS